MQKFEYRTPRFPVNLPVVLRLKNLAIAGRCREISKEGMKVELEKPVSPETCGEVYLEYQDLSLEVRVSVAHAGENFEGLKFLFESEDDRKAVERLVALLSGPTGKPGPVLVR